MRCMPEVSRQAMTSCSRCGHSFEADSLGASTWMGTMIEGDDDFQYPVGFHNLFIEMMYLILSLVISCSPKSWYHWYPKIQKLV